MEISYGRISTQIKAAYKAKGRLEIKPQTGGEELLSGSEDRFSNGRTANKQPLRGTVSSASTGKGSPSGHGADQCLRLVAKHNSCTVWVKVSSVTVTQGQTACSISSFPNASPALRTKSSNSASTFGLSATDPSGPISTPAAVSRVKPWNR